MRVLHDVLHNWTHLKHRRTYSRVVKNTLIKSTEKLRCTNLTHNSGHVALIQRTQMLNSTMNQEHISAKFSVTSYKRKVGNPAKAVLDFL